MPVTHIHLLQRQGFPLTLVKNNISGFGGFQTQVVGLCDQTDLTAGSHVQSVGLHCITGLCRCPHRDCTLGSQGDIPSAGRADLSHSKRVSGANGADIDTVAIADAERLHLAQRQRSNSLHPNSTIVGQNAGKICIRSDDQINVTTAGGGDVDRAYLHINGALTRRISGNRNIPFRGNCQSSGLHTAAVKGNSTSHR